MMRLAEADDAPGPLGRPGGETGEMFGSGHLQDHNTRLQVIAASHLDSEDSGLGSKALIKNDTIQKEGRLDKVYIGRATNNRDERIQPGNRNYEGEGWAPACSR